MADHSGDPFGLGVSLPVWAAPMAGGPTTPALVVAAASAGSVGFLAAGYKAPAAVAAEIASVREHTDIFGVNVFAPNPLPVDPVGYARYRDELAASAEKYQVSLPAVPREDDDSWEAKLELLLTQPVPLVSFTFGIPSADVVAALRRAGTVVLQTVTSAGEAGQAGEAGVDALVLQGSGAGGHSGTLSPAAPIVERPLSDLVAEVAQVVRLPLIAAGGIGEPAAARTAVESGASAVAVGTALLLAPEAGTSSPYRTALIEPDAGPTVLTRAFSGRPARGLANRFIADHDRTAPLGYPAVHHLTTPLRRAAVAAGDPQLINLWAGTGFRAIRAMPAAHTLQELSGGL